MPGQVDQIARGEVDNELLGTVIRWGESCLLKIQCKGQDSLGQYLFAFVTRQNLLDSLGEEGNHCSYLKAAAS